MNAKEFEQRYSELREDIGRRLRDTRLARNLTQAQLAERAGCTKSQISQMENGSGSYSLRAFFGVCDALEADLGLLFAGTPPHPLPELYVVFEKAVAAAGLRAAEFLLSLDGDELKLVCQRGLEAVTYRRSLENNRDPNLS